jgi:hypothetical protein
LLTVAEAATEFFVPEKTIRTWIARDYLGLRNGLVSEAELAEVEKKLRRKPREGQLLALADHLKHDVSQANPS